MWEGNEIQDIKSRIKLAKRYRDALVAKPTSPIIVAINNSIAEQEARLRELRIYAWLDWYNEAAESLGEPKATYDTMQKFMRTLNKV